jgi:hypothetical protein
VLLSQDYQTKGYGGERIMRYIENLTYIGVVTLSDEGDRHTIEMAAPRGMASIVPKAEVNERQQKREKTKANPCSVFDLALR